MSRLLLTVTNSVDIPTHFGRYRILQKLGEGGMGAVYLAEDGQLGRRVAIKVPHFSAGGSPSTIERFYREARVAAGIDHPNICGVYDVGQIDGTHFLTMPFIDGVPLSGLVGHDKAWPPGRALRLVSQIATAIQTMHERGLMHR